MHVSKVSLNDVRGFTNLDFDLSRPHGTHAGWTVFTGDNGSGKSALLKAIAIGLIGKDAARSLQPSFRRWIRHGCERATIRLDIVRTMGDDELSGAGKAPSSPFPAKLILANGSREPSIGTAIPPDKPEK